MEDFYQNLLPQELYTHEVIQYLPVEDILKLCTTSSTLSKICQENSTWQYLIGRDFGIVYEGKDSKKFYFRARDIHSMSDIFDPLTDLPGKLGYVKRDDKWEFSTGPLQFVLENYYPKLGNDYFFKHVSVFTRDLGITREKEQYFQNILPPMFHPHYIGAGHGWINIDLKEFAKVFDFYRGHGAFLKELENFAGKKGMTKQQRQGLYRVKKLLTG